MKKAKAKRKTFKSLKAAGKAMKRKVAKPAQAARGVARGAGKIDIAALKIAPALTHDQHKLLLKLAPRPANTRWPSEIKRGKRFRKVLLRIPELAKSIDDRGALMHPVVIDKDDELIAGERRLAAWPLTRLSDFGAKPVPVRIVDVDSIVAGEYDENTQREPFTPSEAVAIKRALEPIEQRKAAERQKAGKAASQGKGRAADKISAITGRDRKTLAKAEEVVVAAEQNPARFGKLKEAMDRTGKVNGPHRRLKIMKATDALRKAPPPLPLQGPYGVIAIDYPSPNEPDMTQEELDAAGRSLRPYPAMAIQEGCKFLAEKIRPLMAENCTVYFWVTNYQLINGHADKLLHALGLDERSTMETWVKDKMGRGQVRRDQTEHCIIAMRGKPVVNLTNESTAFSAPRLENSRKPEIFYRRVEATSPAPRYLEVFSTGGVGELWDCYGDQAHLHAKPKACDDLLTALEAVEKGETVVGKAIAKDFGNYATGKNKLKLTKAGINKLAALREDAADRAIMAQMPNKFDELVEAYREAMTERHAAVLARDAARLLSTHRKCELLLRKADGGERDEFSVGKGMSDKLLRACNPEVGAVPMWGQQGIFEVDVDGTPYIASIDSGYWLEVYAVDPDKPCISESGFHSLGFVFSMDDLEFAEDEHLEEILGQTVEAVVSRQLREFIATPEGAGKRARPRKLMLPEKVFKLPKAWKANFTEPVELTRREIKAYRAARDAAAKAADPLSAMADANDMVKVSADHVVAREFVTPQERSKLVYDPRQLDLVEAAMQPPKDFDPLARRQYPAGHVIRNWTDDSNGRDDRWVATCECGGFECRATCAADNDWPVELHWRAVEAAQPDIARVDGTGQPLAAAPAAGAAQASLQADADHLDIPPFLRRSDKTEGQAA